jgi:hypothetical protein
MPDTGKKKGDGADGDGAGAKGDAPEPQAVVEKYFLVVVGDEATDSPQLTQCDTLEMFAAAVNEHVLNAKQTIYAYGFKGQRVQISAPTPICAVEINGKRAEVGSEDRNFEASGRITPLRRGVSE